MKIDNKTVEWLAFLAHLNVEESQIESEVARLKDMAEVIGAIKEAETEGVKPMKNPFDATLTLRADVVTEENHRDERQTLSERVENGLYLVPQVIE